ncbi:glucosamine-6-phosphate deaminase [Nakamurella flavida]|uniref:glucosamine-6-phosphate deaminase n=1 Tax=Nakamurella flavida TaxID=363630 RepID=UPI0027852A94|nr:glucosamine-6-phosphate deaminase [Nakamurella flavida]MDP9778702.1 glucosamine-6-phosphate deaminase [Nakamurella flavida]
MITTHVVPDARTAGSLVAERIARLVRAVPAAVIGVATGSSPLPVYRALADLVDGGLDLSRVTWFALDEYVGLPPEHPESYRSVLDRELVAPLGLDRLRVHVPEPGSDPYAAAAAYEADIVRAGGIDLQLLGIGGNGHLGFNEPGTPFGIPTHVAELTHATRRDNARFFPSLLEVPTLCVTQGLGTIGRARAHALIATGEAKAAAVAAALTGPVGPECPGSLLQRCPDVFVALDDAAAGGVEPTGQEIDAVR